MSRIRSIHPKVLTDESFMDLTVKAPLGIALLIGLWMEADDNGIFEWKPLTLKARILPAAPVDLAALLLELECRNFIKRYAIGGREYGAIRNFRKFQRPKKPKTVHPITPMIATYIGSSEPSTELGEDEAPFVPPLGEMSPQMEEEGGRREEGERKNQDAPPASPGRSSGYAFAGAVIRLNQKDFDNWRKAYSEIPDLTAELTALDDWIRTEPEADRKRWFHVVSGALKKKHNAAAAARASPKKVVGLDF